jgi:serine/threonine protein kinase
MDFRQVGKYAVVEKIGAGAMGEVFRAHDPVLDRDVAIKVVLGKLSEDEKARERFLHEAQAAAHLNHPNIITLFDFGEESGTAYMVMELLEGSDLKHLIEAGKLQSRELALSMMEQILDGLAFAHARGVLHRDLKPGNIHVLPSGRIKIMDFGLARRTADAAASGVVMGTPYYMAPEQVRGDPPTTRSDIFSVGAMFYEMLSGRRPFTGTTIPSVLLAVLQRDPEPLGRLAPELESGIVALVMRALAKDPLARHADAGEMLRALRVVLFGGDMAQEEAAYATDDPSPSRELGPAPSTLAETDPELRGALAEVEQYLEDRVPPLMVADSVGLLMASTPRTTAAEIRGWVDRLLSAQPGLALGDALFHAVHKLSVIGELDLVDNARLLEFLRSVGDALAASCPPGTQRDRFRRGLATLGEQESLRSAPVERTLPAQTAPMPEGVAASNPWVRRLSVLEQRLRREGTSQAPAGEMVRRRVASQAIAAAALYASNDQELERNLRRLSEVGVAAGSEQVFRSLGQQLGNWALPKELAADTAALPPADEVRAMKQIVALPEDPAEVGRRYRELVTAATEEFNEGNLGRAVQMFDVARRLASEKRVEAGFLEPIQRKGHEALDPARLRQYMDRPDRHQQLQAVMEFFAYGLSAERLLEQLEVEERRERRRLQLDLLVVHGEKARALARAKLEAADSGAATDYARRNWIYLLRLVPRPAGEAFDAEIEAVARCAQPVRPAFLVKEALTHLGQTRHPRMADVLGGLLAAWEGALAKPDVDDAGYEEGLAALDRIAAALARQGGPRGWRALVRHGLSQREELGDTLARLAELGSQDLSPSPDVIETLLAEVHAALPRRSVLGRLVSRRDEGLAPLIGALAGTRTPEVVAVLEDIAKRFEATDAGRAAARALEAPLAASAPQPPAVAHSGELDGYSLPALLHRLCQERQTGVLSLQPREGASGPALIGLADGQITSVQFEHRRAADALFQLFERPFPGEFAFEAKEPPPGGTPLGELAALVREGLRRWRQVAVASAIVPDDAPLEATGEAPGTVADEPEYELVVSLWQKACSRVTVRQMESELAADAFRILRPLAQWVEQGALRMVGTEPTGEPKDAPPGAAAPDTGA